MLAWMDAEAERLTRETARRGSGAARARSCGTRARRPGTCSRSRRSATTATATRSCCACARPGRRATPARARASRPALWRTISEREAERPEGSYVVSLLDAGVARCAQKVGEEGVEAALAAVAGDERARRRGGRPRVPPLRTARRAPASTSREVEDELARRANRVFRASGRPHRRRPDRRRRLGRRRRTAADGAHRRAREKMRAARERRRARRARHAASTRTASTPASAASSRSRSRRS